MLPFGPPMEVGFGRRAENENAANKPFNTNKLVSIDE
jgi:hypothetical protein